MSCVRIQRRLSAFLDGELSPRRAAAVRRHLAECPGCDRAAGELRQLAQLAGRLATHEPSAELLPRILAAVPPERREIARSWGRGGWWLALGSAVAAAGMLVLVLHRKDLGERPEREAPPWAFSGARGGATNGRLLASAEQELTRAAARYRRAIQELRQMVAEDSHGWHAPQRQSYSRTLEMLEESVARSQELVRIAATDAGAHEVLFSAYRQQIDFMQASLLGGAAPSVAASPEPR
ncbi:MAG: zf-HC2 domain-containing protein [Deltaproteobacteria bacterium]|nr:zf-HC2 domain-containing protein [Deltaproteobacteria bacterium]